MREFLMWENEPVAVPAFRSIAIVEGTIHAPTIAPHLRKLYAQFEARFGTSANETSYHFPGYKGKIRPATQRILNDGRAYLARDGGTPYGEGLRRYGHALADFPHPGLPFFGIEQRSDRFFLETAIPQDSPHWHGFAQEVSATLMELPTISGTMGMGRFLPPHKSSLRFLLSADPERHRAAFSTDADMVEPALRREGSPHRWKAGEEAGIADVGWRTFIGREYWDRIEPALASLARDPDIAIERSPHLLSITAGDRPIWGSPDETDALRPYRTVARALEPVRQPLGAARAFWFGGGATDDHDDRVAAYLARLEQA